MTVMVLFLTPDVFLGTVAVGFPSCAWFVELLVLVPTSRRAPGVCIGCAVVWCLFARKGGSCGAGRWGL